MARQETERRVGQLVGKVDTSIDSAGSRLGAAGATARSIADTLASDLNFSTHVQIQTLA
jgi:hypothetical protein